MGGDIAIIASSSRSRSLLFSSQTIEDTLIVLTIDSDGNKQIFTRFFYRKIVHNADQWSLLLAGCYIHSEQNLLIRLLHSMFVTLWQLNK